jgi:hypothetical protein
LLIPGDKPALVLVDFCDVAQPISLPSFLINSANRRFEGRKEY